MIKCSIFEICEDSKDVFADTMNNKILDTHQGVSSKALLPFWDQMRCFYPESVEHNLLRDLAKSWEMIYPCMN